MQTLPAQLLEQIFQHTGSKAVSEKSCASLAITCKAFRDAFADSGRQESCKKAALKRLLRWSAKVERTLYKPGKVHPPVRLNIRATLDKRKTQRLTEWLESGLLSIEDFWEAQDPRMAVEEKHGEPIKFLYLVLVAELPTEQFLDGKTKKVLQDLMAHFVPLALTDFNGVQMLHDPFNGEKLTWFP